MAPACLRSYFRRADALSAAHPGASGPTPPAHDTAHDRPGFEAYWRGPEELLKPEVRSAQSMWALLEEPVQDTMVARLRDALASGAWDAEHGHLRSRDSFDGSLRLVISEPG